jgi:quercetin dioxygenase-like cupin family protein
MSSNFRIASEIEPEQEDRGTLRWVSHPRSTSAKMLTVLDVTFAPDRGHSFHKHPDQEEVIYVTAGELEQWVEREKRILSPGDAVFLPAGMVHALFNAGQGECKFLAIFSPSVGANGLETIEVADQAPWCELRNTN